MSAPNVFIVVPCYNEEEALPETARCLTEYMEELIFRGRMGEGSRIVFVDDGSRDGTWPLIASLSEQSPRVEGIKLAHNAGHQNALWGGMMAVRERCDALISIDADLQDDIHAMEGFLDELEKGCDVVYGVRKKRDADAAFKRFSAEAFYHLLARMGVETVYNHADYRLLSRRALDALSQFGEVNLYLRGMVPLLGFKSAQVGYSRSERLAGKSKYPLKKMLALAWEGITSFSVKPIHMVLIVGLLFACMGIIMALYALISRIAGHAVAGWTSIMISIWLIGGVQLIALGLIGEYVGKVYTEVKRRPRYIIEKELRHE